MYQVSRGIKENTRNEWTDGGNGGGEKGTKKKKKEERDRWGKVAEKGGREGEMDRPRSSIESEECALLGAFTRAKRDVGEPCVSK